MAEYHNVRGPCGREFTAYGPFLARSEWVAQENAQAFYGEGIDKMPSVRAACYRLAVAEQARFHFNDDRAEAALRRADAEWKRACLRAARRR